MQNKARDRDGAKETVVLSLGGSLVNPGQIDLDFLEEFRGTLTGLLDRKRFVVVVGGGSVCRAYNKAADVLAHGTAAEQKDWMGIYATMVNAQLVKIMFGARAAGVFQDPMKKPAVSKPVTVASGWKPGFSTDCDAVLWAKTMNARTVVNMTDVDYIYTADPDFDKTAKPVKALSWDGYKKLIGGEWKPGMNVPFDPVASREAQRLGLKVMIVNGRETGNLKRLLEGNEFVGTTIG